VRLDLTGRTEAHVELVRGTVLVDLIADMRHEQLAGAPWVWIDRVLDRTSAALDIDGIRASEDFAGDLARLADEVLADPALMTRLITECTGAIESALGVHGDGFVAGELVERARDVCLDRLEGEIR
jgi:hypothetical protein